MADPTDLVPTAALVMLWARDLYRAGNAARFYSCLDLGKGERMRRECEAVCPWYAEVILNRKWFIRRLPGRSSGRGEVSSRPRTPGRLRRWDRIGDRGRYRGDGGEAAALRAGGASPGREDPVRRCRPRRPFGHGRGDRRRRLRPRPPDGRHHRRGLLPRSPAVLAGIVSLFASPGRRNRAIVEYLLPCRLVAEERRGIPREIWRIINRDCNAERTVTYSPEEMEQALARAGCDSVVQHSMHDIELHRTGANRYFPTDPDGWIQIAHGRL